MNKKECPSCYGEGTWETECCNGSGGCSCGGGLVNMGRCRVCNGSGFVIEGGYNPRANSDYIMSTGACFAGSGPTSGYWANKPALGRPSKTAMNKEIEDALKFISDELTEDIELRKLIDDFVYKRLGNGNGALEKADEMYAAAINVFYKKKP